MREKTGAKIGRIILGILLVVFGLNGFLNFLPMPPMPEAAAAFMGAIMQAGYLWPVIKGLEIIIGVMLLANYYVPLALVLLAPLSVNFMLLHIFLALKGIAPALVITGLNIYLASCHWQNYELILER